jgi:hypothetical protein
MAFNTFFLDDGTGVNGGTTNPINVSTGQTATLTDDGVTFTLSVNNSFVQINNPVGTGPSSGAGNWEIGPNAQFTLSASGPSGSGFVGTPTNPISIQVAAGVINFIPGLFQRWTFVHRTNTASNVVRDFSFSGIPHPGTITQVGDFSHVVFTTNSPVTATLTQIGADVSCFTAGTLIATPDGPRAVETLNAGDRVLTADGGETTVKWLGRQPVDTRIEHPAKINPICITAGALGYNLPERDLRVSPDHGIAIDGYLINAGALVNGTTIYQERNVSEDFTYYHIETDAHELILAEGVAAETFADFSARVDFENADEASGRVIPEMPLPRISSARMVPAHVKSYLGEVRVA